MVSVRAVLIAALVALAAGQADAVAESRLRVRIHTSDSVEEEKPAHHHHHHKEPALCSRSDQTAMIIEGVQGTFCVTGEACGAAVHGACPGAQSGLNYGSYCDLVADGVYGCKAYSEDRHLHHHKAHHRSHGKKHGKKATEEEEVTESEETSQHHHKKKHHHHKAALCSGADQTAMIVEGVQGTFCVTGKACASSVEGACPGAQSGLNYGSYCDLVADGVYGCKAYSEDRHLHHHKGHHKSSHGKSHGKSHHKSHNKSAHAEEETTTESTHHKKKHHHHKAALCSGADQTAMIVEGVQGTFCVTGQACASHIEGVCPGAQSGLNYGSYCDLIADGVYGCKAYSEDRHLHHHKAHHHSNGKVHASHGKKHGKKHHHKEPALCSGANQSQMLVDGVGGIFCITGEACAGSTKGACPGPQSGLNYGSHCQAGESGVYSCVAKSAF